MFTFFQRKQHQRRLRHDIFGRKQQFRCVEGSRTETGRCHHFRHRGQQKRIREAVCELQVHAGHRTAIPRPPEGLLRTDTGFVSPAVRRTRTGTADKRHRFDRHRGLAVPHALEALHRGDSRGAVVLAGVRVVLGGDARETAAVRYGVVAGPPAGLQGAAGQHGGRGTPPLHDTLCGRVAAEFTESAHLFQSDRYSAVRLVPGAFG